MTTQEQLKAKIEELETEIDHHRRHAFDAVDGEYHQAEILRLKRNPILKAANRKRRALLAQHHSEAILRRWQ